MTSQAPLTRLGSTGFGIAATPWGDALVFWGDGGITALSFHDSISVQAIEQIVTHHDRRVAPARRALASTQDPAALRRDHHAAAVWIERALASPAPTNPSPIAPRGTPFQQQVWDALRTIPAGETRTYGQIAEQIGAPRSARAVGAAVGANPIAWLIPCHRVLPASGGLGGFRWGAARKRALLLHEGGIPPREP